MQKKHRHQHTAALGYVIDRESPAKGCRHAVTKRDIRDFVALIPAWNELALGLESIVLTAGSSDHDGRYQVFRRERTGSIQIPAWGSGLWTSFGVDYFDHHQAVFERIGLAYDRTKEGVECRFTPAQLRAFVLLHVFMHEIGHHIGRMKTKRQDAAPYDEHSAEGYANAMLDVLWPGYVRTFGDPSRGHSDVD